MRIQAKVCRFHNLFQCTWTLPWTVLALFVPPLDRARPLCASLGPCSPSLCLPWTVLALFVPPLDRARPLCASLGPCSPSLCLPWTVLALFVPPFYNRPFSVTSEESLRDSDIFLLGSRAPRDRRLHEV